MKFKILHLSDFHFKNRDANQDVILSSLYTKLKELSDEKISIDVIIITGDVAYSGKETEYIKAKEYIEKILKLFNLPKSKVFIVPGNHDVNRELIHKDHIKWWYHHDSEESIISTLSSDIAYQYLSNKFTDYYTFVQYFQGTGVSVEKYGQYIINLPIIEAGAEPRTIKIVGINSSFFCGYDGDDIGEIAVGLEQSNWFVDKIDKSKDIVISCIHHPFSCFNKHEGPSQNTILRNTDILCCGHVHEQKNSATRDGNYNEVVIINSGATYERRDTQNGFNIIEIDTLDNKGHVKFYKYLPDQHKWIINKDINSENDGVFEFAFQKNNTVTKTNGSDNIPFERKYYKMIIDIQHDDINRETIFNIVNELESYTKDMSLRIAKIETGSLIVYFRTMTDIISDINNYTIIAGLKIESIEKIDNLDETMELENNYDNVLHWKLSIKKDYYDDCINPGASFTHDRVDTLSLKDIYVEPNLIKIERNKKSQTKSDKTLKANEILEKKSNNPLKAIIYGEDLAGKSTLLKWWYLQYYEAGYVPILLSGIDIKEIKSEKLKKYINRELIDQYNVESNFDIGRIDADKLIIIIDDFHKTRFTQAKYKVNLLSNLLKEYNNIIIVCNEFMMYEIDGHCHTSVQKLIEDVDKYKIIEFGPKLRYQIIKKWCSLGGEQLDQNEMIRNIHETEDYVEAIIGKNFIPSYPIFLLTILQAKEAESIQNPEYGMHGFYYELLINESLYNSIRDSNDIGFYYNFITDYTFYLFQKKLRWQSINIKEFLDYFKTYCQEYNVDMDFMEVFESLQKAKILKHHNNQVSIYYKYVYYFFVARYLSNNISDEIIKNIIKSLCLRMYRDEYSNIIMFLIHLSKDQFILKEILADSKEIFNEYQPIKMDEDVTFINNMIDALPGTVYKPISIEEAKEEDLKDEEDLHKQEMEYDANKEITDYDINEDISNLDLIAKMVKALRTISVLGQITKKNWGELKAGQKYEMAEEAYMLGLRTLGFYFDLVKKGSDNLIEYLTYIYKRKHLDIHFSKEDLKTASREYLFGICVLSSYGIIKRITNSIGYDKLFGTFEKISQNHKYISVKLIDTSIKLEYKEEFPLREISKLKENIKNHFLAQVILQDLAINYLRIFNTTYEEKQSICNMVGIKIDEQRMIDIKSEVKK